jgi:hypothetical protein
MRLVRWCAVPLILVVTPGLALAQVRDCKAVSGDFERLACYDKLYPRVSATQQPKPSSPADFYGSEEDQMKQKLKPICKGC